MDDFSQGVPSLDIYLKRGTPDVPADKKYHVVVAGQIVASFGTKPAGLAAYRKRLADAGHNPPPRDTMSEADFRREHIERDLDRTASYWNDAHQHRGGGKYR